MVLIILIGLVTSFPALVNRMSAATQRPGSDFAEVRFLDSNHGWILSHRGNMTAILRTRDSGRTWQAASVSDTVIRVSFASDRLGWAVGAEGTVLFTDDGGETWNAQTSNTSETLYDLCIIDKNRVWASGNHGTLLTTGDGGKSWAVRNVGLDVALTGIAFVGDERGWAIGYGAVLSTIDGGLNWKSESSGEWKQLSSIRFANENIGWIATAGTAILKTSDGGATWREQVVPGTGRVAISFVDSQHGWAVMSKGASTSYKLGSKFGPESVVLLTHDGGESWHKLLGLKSNSINRAWIADIFFLDRSHGWAVGADGLFLVSIDGGRHWKRAYPQTR